MRKVEWKFLSTDWSFFHFILKGKGLHLPIGPSNGGITFLSRSIAFRHSFWTDCICCILSGNTHFCSFIAVMVSSCRFSAVCSMTPSRYLRHSRKLASQYLSHEISMFHSFIFSHSIDLSRIFFKPIYPAEIENLDRITELKYRLTTDRLIFFFFFKLRIVPTCINR